MWSKCYCRTPKRKQFTTIKCKVQNNRKIQKGRQVLRQLRQQNKKGNSYIPGGFSTKIIPYIDFTSYGSVSKIQTQDHNHNKWYFNEILLFFLLYNYMQVLSVFCCLGQS